jgi:hypothetical protein
MSHLRTQPESFKAQHVFCLFATLYNLSLVAGLFYTHSPCDMSDPLSVAGSAVGIISLGIQVCQGLISYLQSFKSQDQDIQDSLNDIQTVTSILYSLKDVLPKVDKSASETPAIRRCLAESEEKLREFQQFSLKLRANESPKHDVLGRMDHARRALLYPFREGKLKSLCQSLNGLLQNLSLCLDINSLYVPKSSPA